ncbi:MAG: hydrogenase maturation nickel metallochaperone HypA [Desulfobacterales bacterium]|nr:hydrogenase maturation nickel metallochaperone HypA [Desulfobacterales bacterium]
MHEEPYAQAMLDLALEKAGPGRIKEIHLGVGGFSAIVPASLEIFFSHLSRGTRARGAVLVFEPLPVILTCRACNSDIALTSHRPIRQVLAGQLKKGCSCGEKQLHITGGMTVELIRLKVDED